MERAGAGCKCVAEAGGGYRVNVKAVKVKRAELEFTVEVKSYTFL